MKKSAVGLALLAVVAFGSTGCSKHARAFWSGAAIGVLASNAFCASCEHTTPCETVEYVVEPGPCETEVHVEYYEESWR